MLKVTKFAGLAIAMSAVALTAVTPADAQRRNRGGDERAQQQRTPPVSRGFATAYQPLNTAIEASDWAAADTALAALRAAASSDYERFLVAQSDFRIASGQNNDARLATAVTAMIDSNGAPADAAPQIYTAGAQIAYNAEDFATAAARAKHAIGLGADAANLPNLMIVSYFRSGQIEQGMAEANAIMAAAESAGQPAPEAIYSVVAQELQRAERNAELIDILIKRANAYPTAENFRIASMIYLQNTPENRGTTIDTLRLMSAADAMNDRRYYVEYATTLGEDALPAEALRAVAAARAANLVPAGDATFAEIESMQRQNLSGDLASLPAAERRAVAAPEARLAVRIADAYLSHENYAKAEELYTGALTKTGADAELINMRLGITRLRAGNHSGALEAFGRVQQGVRAPLARLWEGYVRSQGAPAADAAPAAEPADEATAG